MEKPRGVGGGAFSSARGTRTAIRQRPGLASPGRGYWEGHGIGSFGRKPWHLRTKRWPPMPSGLASEYLQGVLAIFLCL